MSDPIPPPSGRARRRRRTSRGLRSRAALNDPSISPEEIRGALQKIIGSEDFPATNRNRRFLVFVVEKTLSGRPQEVSGYHVATEVFGRSAEFNPTTDPIVRIEAAKLRRDLETYYLKSGAADRVRIELPRGGYIPVFTRAEGSPVGAGHMVLDPRGVTIDALHGNNGRLAQLHPPLRARIADRLARQTDLAIFTGPAHNGDGELLDSDTARELARSNGTRFVLSGDAHGDGETVLLTARLHDGATGRLLWSEDFAGTPAELEQAVARRVAEEQLFLTGKLGGSSGNPVSPA